jgi:predicted nuclease of predicted toxin-antitoxin system
MMARLKLDENLPRDAVDLFNSLGHDAVSVVDQSLGGHSDESVAEVCRRELRAVVTLDLDFSNIRTMPPEEYCGIVVLRLRKCDRISILAMLQRIAPLLDVEPLAGHLWIVDESRVRIRGEA